MKYLSLLFLLISSSVMANNYQSDIDTYDPVSGLYYKAIGNVFIDKKSFLSSKSLQYDGANINIFNPADETSALLFKAGQKDGIPIFLFETGFKDGIIEFSGTAHQRIILNNTNVKKRELKNKLLVGLRSMDSNATILYVSDKKGSNLKKLVIVPDGDSWHIDVKNSKLRVIHQRKEGVTIESYVW